MQAAKEGTAMQPQWEAMGQSSSGKADSASR